jgi:hypothetical protein
VTKLGVLTPKRKMMSGRLAQRTGRPMQATEAKGYPNTWDGRGLMLKGNPRVYIVRAAVFIKLGRYRSQKQDWGLLRELP